MFDEDTISNQAWHLKQGGSFLTPLANPYFGWSHSLSGVTAAQIERAMVEPKWPPRFVKKIFGMDEPNVDSSTIRWSLSNFRPTQQMGRTTYGVVTIPGTKVTEAVECSRPCLSELKTWATERKSWASSGPVVGRTPTPGIELASLAGMKPDDVPLWGCCKRRPVPTAD